MTNPPEPPPSNQPLSSVDPLQMQLTERWAVTIKSEDAIEKEYRLKNERNEAIHKRWRSTVLFIVIIVALGVLFYYCLQINNNPNATADDKKWATATITLIVGAGVGFVTGKAIA